MQELYIQRRRAIEREEEDARTREEVSSGVIRFPQPADVLIGRGRPYQEFPGNQRFGRLVDSQLKAYQDCSKFSKTCLSMDIVKTVQQYGGRFIEKTDADFWKVVDDSMAREKVSASFRTRAKLRPTPNDTAKLSRVLSNGGSSREAKRFRFDPWVSQS